MKPEKMRVPVALVLLSVVLLLSSCAKDPQKAKAKYLALGQSYMKKGQYGDAAIEFRNAIRLDPRFVDAYYQLAQAELAKHDWSAAYASLETTIALDPTRLDARLDRARLYLAARDFDKAEEDADFILQQEPNDVAAFQLKGATLIGQQKPNEALAAFSKVIELRPNDPRAYVNLALAEISLRHYAAAEQHLKEAVGFDPKFLPAYTDLANLYRLQNQLPQAQQVLQDGVAKNPDGILLYIDWASMLASQGRKDDARVLLDKLGQQLPNSVDAAIAIGDFYFERKELDQALGEYRRGLSISAKNIAVRKRIEDLYLSTGRAELAADLDRELMKDAPKDIAVRIDHGRLLMVQGKPGDAAIFLQKVVADAADSAPAYYYLAIAHWQNGDPGRAHSALLDALKASPGLPIALEGLARLSLAQGNPAEAQIYAQELIQKFPADPSHRQLLAQALGRQKDFRQAEEQILVAKQLTPNDAMVHLNLAQIYSVEKKWPEAQKEFETALQLDPHNTTALAQYADYLVGRNQSVQASVRVQQYVTSNPNDASGHIILGVLNFKSKNYGLAQAEFERAIQIDPQQVQAYLRLGKVYEVQGQTDQAIARYEKALDFQPKLAPLATMIGNLYLNKGDLETARKYYRQALDVDPDFAVANANMAWVDAQEDQNLDLALAMAQKAKSEMPETPSITDTLAWVMYKRGSYESALPLAEECVEKSPDSAEFRYHLGMTLMAVGQKAEGKQQLETALRMKLDAADAQQAQRALTQVR